MKNITASLLLPLLALLGASACTDAGKCTRGDRDCAPVENEALREELNLNADGCKEGLFEENGRCVAPEGNQGGRGGSGGRRARSLVARRTDCGAAIPRSLPRSRQSRRRSRQ